MKNQKNCSDAEYLFHQGTNYYAYNYLGVTVEEKNKKYVYTFRTWAPNAYSVALVSDFFGWERPIEMKKISIGVWETVYTSETALTGALYKYKISGKNGVHLKGDPYANYSTGGADGASIIYHSDFTWSDREWIDRRKRQNKNNDAFLPIPINIYELHIGSFMRSNTEGYTSYRDLARILPSYIRYMGYTHVEFMPISEYPYDASWGYQVGAFYAPSSRFGTPDDFRYLIDTLHQFGIGVIIDWVPAHFPKDEWGLYEFDGGPLYEYQGLDRQESLTWGTRFFDVGREEVQSFLISNALYYFREFHIDGLRVDAVASMLYLDYDKPDGVWIKNENGGKENLEAIAFFKKLNERVFLEFPDALMIAEESGDFGKITHPTSVGGLGFNLKWNMGWANDFYDYLETDPIYRKHKHSALTFPIMYAYSENYVLPISHDEVVHGKKALIDKMFGSYEDKFKQIRTALLLTMTYPGKKLLFMGSEFGQFREWDYKSSVEWFMLDYKKHHALREYVAALNRFYLSQPALWEYDYKTEGFEWISVDENEKNLIVFKRNGIKNSLIIIINFSGTEQFIKFSTSCNCNLKCLFSTDDTFCGEDILILQKTEDTSYFDAKLPAFSGRIYAENKIKRKIY